MILYGGSKPPPYAQSPSTTNRQNKNALSIPSAHGLHPRPPVFFSGRADNACTNLLGFLV